jgi:methionyl-tRNA formyltransferase
VRLVFLGSPDFALPTLRGLLAGYEVVGVVTQPDRPAGRGRALHPPPVKEVAERAGIPVFQPPRLRGRGALAQLKRWAPDVIVVAAYGQILRPELLEMPRFGCLNVHASLLPRWRGAAPVQAAILNGDATTGVTIMLMDPGMDTGPILSQRANPILPDDTGGSLSAKLSVVGADLLLEVLPAHLRGQLHPRQQDETEVTYAPLLSKADGRMDLRRPASFLERQVRAFDPWPGSYLEWNGRRLVVKKAHAVIGESAEIGRVQMLNGFPAIGTPDGLLVLDSIQPAGRTEIPGDAFVRGARGLIGALLPSPGDAPSRVSTGRLP